MWHVLQVMGILSAVTGSRLDEDPVSEETRKKLTAFFSAPRHACILLSVERGKAVVADEPSRTLPHTPPQARGKRLRGLYLLKARDGVATMENFHASVVYGTIGGDIMDSLIDFIRHYHCSIIRDNRILPEGTRLLLLKNHHGASLND